MQINCSSHPEGKHLNTLSDLTENSSLLKTAVVKYEFHFLKITDTIKQRRPKKKKKISKN